MSEWVIVKGSVVDRIVPPHNYILISRTCEYVILLGKRDFADVIKLQSWDAEIILNYLCGPNAIRGKQEDQSEKDVLTKAGVVVRERDLEMLHCWHEDRGRGHKPRNAGSF